MGSPQALTREEFQFFKHPLYPRRFALALFFALILFPLIAAALAAGTVVLVAPLFALLFWMSGRVLYATFMGHSILVSDLNYARIHGIGEELKARIGYEKKVDIFVYEQGRFNTSLYKFLFYRRAVFLNSELLESGVTEDELRWLIGRFIGYLRARREAGFWGWTIDAAGKLLIFNLFLAPYERALVYTGDRVALGVIGGDISSAVSAMQKLFVGRQLGYSVNPSGIVAQHRMVKGTFFGFLARVPIAFPHMTSRYVDLIGFAKRWYGAQFQRFDAANPGLPGDLERLMALPNAGLVTGGNPIGGPLIAAAATVALLTLFTMKVVAPRVHHPVSLNSMYPWATINTPSQGGTTTTTTRTTSTTGGATGAGAATNDGTQAQPYTSQDGGYSVMFPGTPQESSTPLPLGASGSTTLYRAVYVDGNVTYLVAYCDYPLGFLGFDAQTTLGNIRDKFVSSQVGDLTSDDTLDANGVPGRAFTVNGLDGTSFSVRDYLKGLRLYEVIVTAANGAKADGADSFLNSFQMQ